MNKIVTLFYNLLKKRTVVIVDENGNSIVRKLNFIEDSGKAYVLLKRSQIGFLDNVDQKQGEFRRGVSSPTLVRWFNT